MLRHIALTVLFVLSSNAFAGIIGVGGSNADTFPDVASRLNTAEVVKVDSKTYNRISGQIGAEGIATVVVQKDDNEEEKADFIRVYVRGDSTIVDTNFRIKLTD